MEKQKTSSKRKAATKVIVAVLLIAIMTGISFAVANFVHNRKSVQASSVKNGLSAYELAVQQGYAGSLDDWLVSLQGKSAYQIAVDNGYSGSEKDWSKTLTAMSKKDKSDISSAAFSEKGDLVITLSDGTKINVGKAVGASGKDGKDGKDGIGIKSAKINDKGELVISYSDGNSVNLDKVVGETVNNGVGIASSIINEKGELVLTYTNGETANLGGVVGKDGRDGKNGADGRGIAKTELVNGELVITYTDGTSDNLGTINNSIEYLKFTYNSSSNSYMVSVKSDCKDVVKNIVIPEKYNGVSVTKIAMFGFANCPLLESVVMPDTITEIYPTPKDAYIGAGDGIIVGGAFKNCPKLSKVKLSNNLKNLPSGLFIGCSSLKEISIPASVRVIGTYDSSKDTRFLTDGQSVFPSSIVKVYVENTENWMRSSSYHANDYKSKVSADVDPQLLSDPETAATLLKETYIDVGTENMYIYEQKSSE